MSYNTIIIGGGIAGLVAAYNLVKKGYRPLVLEKDPDIGGLVSSYNFEDFSIERYYHHLFPHEYALLELIDELGLGKEIEWKRGSVGYWIEEKAYLLDTPWEILRYPHLSLADKTRLARFVLKIKSVKDFSALDSITACDWVKKNCGEDVYTNFFGPLLKSKFGSTAPKISAAWLCGRIKRRAGRSVRGEKLGYFKKGFSLLVNRLVSEIRKKGEILVNSPVNQIIIENNEVKGVKLANGKTYVTSSAISTIAPEILIKLCKFPFQTQKTLESLKSQSVICALLGLKKSLMNTYWLNIKSKTLPFGILIEHTNFYQIPEYSNVHIVYAVSYHNSPNDQFYQKSDEGVIQDYLKGLRGMFNLNERDVLWWKVSRTTEAGPIYHVNYGSNLPPYSSGIKGLFITGMMHSYPDREIDDAVLQGQKCSNMLLNHLGKAT